MSGFALVGGWFLAGALVGGMAVLLWAVLRIAGGR